MHKFFNKDNLLETLAPPTTAPSGRLGEDKAAKSTFNSASNDRPAAAVIRRGKASIEAWARCAHEKASPT